MRVQLVELHSDGSNVCHLDEAVLLERSVLIDEVGVDEIFSAKDALEKSSTASGVYVVVIRPDEEE